MRVVGRSMNMNCSLAKSADARGLRARYDVGVRGGGVRSKRSDWIALVVARSLRRTPRSSRTASPHTQRARCVYLALCARQRIPSSALPHPRAHTWAYVGQSASQRLSSVVHCAMQRPSTRRRRRRRRQSRTLQPDKRRQQLIYYSNAAMTSLAPHRFCCFGLSPSGSCEPALCAAVRGGSFGPGTAQSVSQSASQPQTNGGQRKQQK